MSNVVAFHSGFLKKAEKIRLERSREEKIENKKSNTDSNNTRPRGTVLSSQNQAVRMSRNEAEEEA